MNLATRIVRASPHIAALRRNAPHLNTARVYQRRGTLWEGRFRSSFVARTEYFLKCHRYIELNPVRPGMVSHPREYAWSSYCTNAELRASRVVTPHEEYLVLGSTPAERCAAYRDLFRFDLHPEDLKQIRSAAAGGFALGNSGRDRGDGGAAR